MHEPERHTLREWLALRELSHMDLAIASHVHLGTISNLVAGRTGRPRPLTARSIAAALQVAPEQILWLPARPYPSTAGRYKSSSKTATRTTAPPVPKATKKRRPRQPDQGIGTGMDASETQNEG